eukprot:jgi/Mesvir1/24036/Mv10774-RA.1
MAGKHLINVADKLLSSKAKDRKEGLKELSLLFGSEDCLRFLDDQSWHAQRTGIQDDPPEAPTWSYLVGCLCNSIQEDTCKAKPALDAASASLLRKLVGEAQARRPRTGWNLFLRPVAKKLFHHVLKVLRELAKLEPGGGGSTLASSKKDLPALWRSEHGAILRDYLLAVPEYCAALPPRYFCDLLDYYMQRVTDGLRAMQVDGAKGDAASAEILHQLLRKYPVDLDASIREDTMTFFVKTFRLVTGSESSPPFLHSLVSSKLLVALLATLNTFLLREGVNVVDKLTKLHARVAPLLAYVMGPTSTNIATSFLKQKVRDALVSYCRIQLALREVLKHPPYVDELWTLVLADVNTTTLGAATASGSGAGLFAATGGAAREDALFPLGRQHYAGLQLASALFPPLLMQAYGDDGVNALARGEDELALVLSSAAGPGLDVAMTSAPTTAVLGSGQYVPGAAEISHSGLLALTGPGGVPLPISMTPLTSQHLVMAPPAKRQRTLGSGTQHPPPSSGSASTTAATPRSPLAALLAGVRDGRGAWLPLLCVLLRCGHARFMPAPVLLALLRVLPERLLQCQPGAALGAADSSGVGAAGREAPVWLLRCIAELARSWPQVPTGDPGTAGTSLGGEAPTMDEAVSSAAREASGESPLALPSLLPRGTSPQSGPGHGQGERAGRPPQTTEDGPLGKGGSVSGDGGFDWALLAARQGSAWQRAWETILRWLLPSHAQVTGVAGEAVQTLGGIASRGLAPKAALPLELLDIKLFQGPVTRHALQFLAAFFSSPVGANVVVSSGNASGGNPGGAGFLGAGPGSGWPGGGASLDDPGAAIRAKERVLLWAIRGTFQELSPSSLSATRRLGTVGVVTSTEADVALAARAIMALLVGGLSASGAGSVMLPPEGFTAELPWLSFGSRAQGGPDWCEAAELEQEQFEEGLSLACRFEPLLVKRARNAAEIPSACLNPEATPSSPTNTPSLAPYSSEASPAAATVNTPSSPHVPTDTPPTRSLPSLLGRRGTGDMRQMSVRAAELFTGALRLSCYLAGYAFPGADALVRQAMGACASPGDELAPVDDDGLDRAASAAAPQGDAARAEDEWPTRLLFQSMLAARCADALHLALGATPAVTCGSAPSGDGGRVQQLVNPVLAPWVPGGLLHKQALAGVHMACSILALKRDAAEREGRPLESRQLSSGPDLPGALRALLGPLAPCPLEPQAGAALPVPWERELTLSCLDDDACYPYAAAGGWCNTGGGTGGPFAEFRGWLFEPVVMATSAGLSVGPSGGSIGGSILPQRGLLQEQAVRLAPQQPAVRVFLMDQALEELVRTLQGAYDAEARAEAEMVYEVARGSPGSAYDRGLSRASSAFVAKATTFGDDMDDFDDDAPATTTQATGRGNRAGAEGGVAASASSGGGGMATRLLVAASLRALGPWRPLRVLDHVTSLLSGAPVDAVPAEVTAALLATACEAAGCAGSKHVETVLDTLKAYCFPPAAAKGGKVAKDRDERKLALALAWINQLALAVVRKGHGVGSGPPPAAVGQRPVLSDRLVGRLLDVVNRVQEAAVLPSGWRTRLYLSHAIKSLLLLKIDKLEPLSGSFLPLLRDPSYLVRTFTSGAVTVCFHVWPNAGAIFDGVLSNLALPPVGASTRGAEYDLPPQGADGNLGQGSTLETGVLALGEIAAASEVVEDRAVFLLCAYACSCPAVAPLVAAQLDGVAWRLGYATRADYLRFHLVGVLACWVREGLSLDKLSALASLLANAGDDVEGRGIEGSGTSVDDRGRGDQAKDDDGDGGEAMAAAFVTPVRGSAASQGAAQGGRGSTDVSGGTAMAAFFERCAGGLLPAILMRADRAEEDLLALTRGSGYFRDAPVQLRPDLLTSGDDAGNGGDEGGGAGSIWAAAQRLIQANFAAVFAGLLPGYFMDAPPQQSPAHAAVRSLLLDAVGGERQLSSLIRRKMFHVIRALLTRVRAPGAEGNEPPWPYLSPSQARAHILYAAWIASREARRPPPTPSQRPGQEGRGDLSATTGASESLPPDVLDTHHILKLLHGVHEWLDMTASRRHRQHVLSALSALRDVLPPATLRTPTIARYLLHILLLQMQQGEAEMGQARGNTQEYLGGQGGAASSARASSLPMLPGDLARSRPLWHPRQLSPASLRASAWAPARPATQVAPADTLEAPCLDMLSSFVRCLLVHEDGVLVVGDTLQALVPKLVARALQYYIRHGDVVHEREPFKGSRGDGRQRGDGRGGRPGMAGGLLGEDDQDEDEHRHHRQEPSTSASAGVQEDDDGDDLPRPGEGPDNVALSLLTTLVVDEGPKLAHAIAQLPSFPDGDVSSRLFARVRRAHARVRAGGSLADEVARFVAHAPAMHAALRRQGAAALRAGLRGRPWELFVGGSQGAWGGEGATGDAAGEDLAVAAQGGPPGTYLQGVPREPKPGVLASMWRLVDLSEEMGDDAMRSLAASMLVTVGVLEDGRMQRGKGSGASACSRGGKLPLTGVGGVSPEGMPSTSGSTGGQKSASLGVSPEARLAAFVLSQLGLFLVDADTRVIAMAFDTAQGVLATELGARSFQQLPPQEQRLLAIFRTGAGMSGPIKGSVGPNGAPDEGVVRACEQRLQARFAPPPGVFPTASPCATAGEKRRFVSDEEDAASDELDEPAVDAVVWSLAGKSYESWVSQLAYMLIPRARSPVLRLCRVLAYHKASFAEQLFPSVLMDIANHDAGGAAHAHLSRLVRDHVLARGAGAGITGGVRGKALQLVLSCLNALRLHRLENIKKSGAPVRVTGGGAGGSSGGRSRGDRRASVAGNSSGTGGGGSGRGPRGRERGTPGGSGGQGASRRSGDDMDALGGRGSSPLAWSKVYWLEVDYLLVAEAAVECSAYFTSLMYVEHWCEEVFGRLTLGEPDFADDGNKEEAHARLLVHIYRSIQDPDGIYGVCRSRRVQEHLRICEHEGKWAAAAASYDQLLRRIPTNGAGAGAGWITGGAAGDDREGLDGGDTLSGSLADGGQNYDEDALQHGMMHALQQMRCMHLLGVYWRGLSAATPRGRPISPGLADMQYEAAWRTGQWAIMEEWSPAGSGFTQGAAPMAAGGSVPLFADASRFPVAGASFHGALCRCLTALESGDLTTFSATMAGAERGLVRSVARASVESVQMVNPSIVKLLILDEVAAAWDAKWARPGSRGWPQGDTGARSEESRVAELCRRWRVHVGSLRDGAVAHYDALEPLFAAHGALLGMLAAPAPLLSHLREAARVSRKASRQPHAQDAILRLKHVQSTSFRGGQQAAGALGTLLVRALVEEAKSLWADGRQDMAIGLARHLLDNDPQLRDHSTGGGKGGESPPSWERADLLCLAGKWLAETRSESSQVIQEEFFLKSVQLWDTPLCEAPKKAKKGAEVAYLGGGGRLGDLYPERACRAHYRMAHFADGLYQALEAQLSSPEYEQSREMRKHAKKEEELLLAAFHRERQKKDTAAVDEIQRQITLLRKTQQLDEADDALHQRHRAAYLQSALQQYTRCLTTGDKYDMKVVFRLVALWFNLRASPEVNALMADAVDLVSSHKFLPLVYQIASRMSSSQTGPAHASGFNVTLAKLVKKMAVEHPHHTLYQLFALSNGDRVKGGALMARDRFVVDQDKKEAAVDVIATVERASAQKKELVRQMKELIEAYVTLAEMPSPKKQGEEPQMPRPIKALRSLGQVPVATAYIPINRSGDYPAESLPSFEGFADKIRLVGGINQPKCIECKGSDGRLYKQLVKSGNDDMRQDAVMEQLFGLVNNLLDFDRETRKRCLHIRTYKVIPFTPTAGMLEWVENTLPIGDYLSNARTGAHLRYGGNDWSHQQCREALSKANQANLLQDYRIICDNFRPVFHHFFLEMFPEPSDWFHKRLTYTRSIAANSIVGYVVGLGDRHSSNILIDENSAEVIHIDLGVAFEQGRMLKTPELIPFRMTRDIVDGMGVCGVNGVLRRCMEETLRVMQANKESLLTIIEVFIHDPLYRWALSPLKALQRQREQGDPGASAIDQVAGGRGGEVTDAKDTNRDAARALLRIKQKLEGYEEGEARGIQGQVQQLLQQAMDPDRLCRLFPGWAPWL